MDVLVNTGRKECSLNWQIENYSHCLLNNGEKLISPNFSFQWWEELEVEDWSLHLYPRGDSEVSKGNISLLLLCNCSPHALYQVPLKFELSLISQDGSVLKSRETEFTFTTGSSFVFRDFVKITEAFTRQKSFFLHQDSLWVRCVMWKGEGCVQSVYKLSALTRIGIKQITFLHEVKSFSTIESTFESLKVDWNILYSEGERISSIVYYSDKCKQRKCCKGKIMVRMNFGDEISTCKIFLVDSLGHLLKLSEANNRFTETKKNIEELSLSLTRVDLINRKNEYLPDDRLSLLLDCTLVTGIEPAKIEKNQHELPLALSNRINNSDRNEFMFKAAGKLSTCPSIKDDFKGICSSTFFSDVSLETKTNSFPAHKIVLCARSSVFKAMLTSNMKEKATNSIQIDDLENETVQQLLLFLYSDNLDNIQWESAMKLYYAADKYNIEKLKVLCSSFLLVNLDTSNACDLLLLADKHSDLDLRKLVENCILENEYEVFGSIEWEKLTEINPQLACKTMMLKYKKDGRIVNEIQRGRMVENIRQFKQKFRFPHVSLKRGYFCG